MKLNIRHPELASLDVLQHAVHDNEIIHRSPHVGNLNNQELSLAFGIGALGGTVQLELVDTIQGDDRYSNPRAVIVGNQNIGLVSRRQAKNKIVGSCHVEPGAFDSLVEAGIRLDPTLMTLKQLHASALEQVLPPSVSVVSSSESFAEIGSVPYGLVMQAAARVIDRPIRQVAANGKLKEASLTDVGQSIYGIGPDCDEGLLPPLEAMMAIEIIKKVIDDNGVDGQIVHVAGPDMIRYTKDDHIMQPAEQIAQRVLSELGAPEGIKIDYVVPCMKTILESDGFKSPIDKTVQSQYDILVQDGIRSEIAC